jgi:hypothetical protein
MKEIKAAGEWFLVPGSAQLEKKERSNLRTSLVLFAKRQNLKVAVGETADGAVIVYHIGVPAAVPVCGVLLPDAPRMNGVPRATRL